MDEVISRYVEGGRDEHFVNWEAMAEGEDMMTIRGVDPETGHTWIDEGLVEDELRRRYLTNPYPMSGLGPDGPLAELVLQCQRCGHHVDILVVSKYNIETYAIKIRGKRIGEFDQSAVGPLTYPCACGRSGIQVSRQRVQADLRSLLAKPVWGKGDEGDGYYQPAGGRRVIRV